MCNSHELYKIIDKINPDIIFEEVPPSVFDNYYITKTRRNLESDTISHYVDHHQAKHIPVDSDNIPNDSFFQDYEYLIKRIESLRDQNGSSFRQLVDNNRINSSMYGFNYLNSSDQLQISDQINKTIEDALLVMNDEKLSKAYQSWKDVNNKREHEMLNNIYNYSRENDYKTAILTIGSGHGRTIIEKIPVYELKTGIQLQWKLYKGNTKI